MRSRAVAGFFILVSTGLVSAGLSTSVQASPAGEVASAFDEGDAIDIHAIVDYAFSYRRASIKREFSGFGGTAEGDPLPIAKDLVYTSQRHEVIPRLEIGFFRDLAVTAALPVVIRDTRELEFDQRDTPCVFPGGGGAATCINADNSTTIRDGLLPPTGFDSDDPTGPGFTNPADPTIFRGATRSGLDQVHLGLVWAAMNQERDHTKPTWKIGAELRYAVGKVARFNPNDPNGDAGVGRGVHEVHLYTTMARRLAWAEPRFRLWYIRPIAELDTSPFEDLGFGQTSRGPQQRAGVSFALEAALWERAVAQQRVSLDFGGQLEGYFEGRAYTEMWEVFALAGRAGSGGPLVLDSDPLSAGVQELSHPGVTNVENHLRFTGHFGLSAEIGPHVRFGLAFRLLLDQAHLITFADAGKDSADDGTLVDPGTDEVNPAYVDTIDLVGRRYRLEEAINFIGTANVRVLFP